MRIALIAAAMLASQTSAAVDISSVEALAQCSDPAEMSKLNHVLFLSTHGDRDAARRYDEAKRNAKACAERALKPAVDAAGKNESLRTAIKDLYIAGNTYIDEAASRAQDRAMAARREAWDRVQMEIKLEK